MLTENSRATQTALGNPIPSEFAGNHQLSSTEAVMWVLCRRRISIKQLKEHDQQHKPLTARFWRRVEFAQQAVIDLVIDGVPATGSLHHEGHADHGRRVRVPADFLKDGAYIEILSGCVLPDFDMPKHFAAEVVVKYMNVELDRDAFFDALRATKTPDAGKDRNSNKAKTDCLSYLKRLMANGSEPTKPKSEYLKDARKLFGGLSDRSFIASWSQASKETSNKNWNRPGRKRKS